MKIQEILDELQAKISGAEDNGQENVVLSISLARIIKEQFYHLDILEEQLSEADQFVKRHEEEGRIFYSGGSIKKAEMIVNNYERERDRAMNMLGSFHEHVIISLRAMELITKQCYGLTHRQQSARMDVLLDTLRETIDKLMEDKSHDWQFVDHEPFTSRNWDFRRLVGENTRLRMQVEELQKKGSIQEE